MTDMAGQARLLCRSARKGALATIGQGKACGEGWPHVSLTSVAWSQQGDALLLLSGLAEHTRNAAADSRVSLLIENSQGHANPQTAPRVSLVGTLVKSDDATLHARFLARHPGAARYAGFGDFDFYKLCVERAHLVGGFGRAHWIKGDDFRTDPLDEDETKYCQSVDADSLALAIGRRAKGWQAVSADADGLDLRSANRFARIDFMSPFKGLDSWRSEIAKKI